MFKIFFILLVGVQCGWNVWGPWLPCSRQCGGGQQSRLRTCASEPCPGPDNQKRMCNVQPCPVDGGWSGYTPASLCTLTCGGGTRIMRRICNAPTPRYGGKYCLGLPTKTQPCNSFACPIDTLKYREWSAWEPWGTCSSPCGPGVRRRVRTCKPMVGAVFCPGLNFQTGPCELKPCPVHGVWSPWSAWGACSVTCGVGKKYMTRQCLNRLHGGNPCLPRGDTMREAVCYKPKCPKGLLDAAVAPSSNLQTGVVGIGAVLGVAIVGALLVWRRRPTHTIEL
eukprot:NODE_3485_length_959_cov_93.277644_g3335_i0.p1 GENE.NODE_3485_length_959_cov_93.277644_g3335_i0~~NODE_3485_length_959_cov_93.277644_g3335_i0.p1  ORF type:complete len:297 (+),score=22.68 NODE_3485_length_959_cov_93.277644_g3335_i0:52-891(+)